MRFLGWRRQKDRCTNINNQEKNESIFRIATQKEFNPKSIILESKIKEERVKGVEEDQELCG